MKEKWLVAADRFTEYCLYGMIFFIPTSIRGIEIFFGLAFLGFLIKKALSPDVEFLKCKENFFLLLFLLFSAASIFNSGPYLSESIDTLVLKWMEYALIFLFVQDTLSNHRRIRNAIVILLIVAGIVGADGLFQKLHGLDFIRQRHAQINIGGFFYGITAAFHHYNDFAGYLIVVSSIIMALLISRQIKRLWIQIPLAVEALLLTACLLFTFSRGGWISFVSALFLMLFLSRRLKEISAFLILFAVVIILVPELRARGLFIFQPEGDADRLDVWGAALRMIKENPFLGKGIGTFMAHFHTYLPSLNVQYAHNCYLQMWAETGIFSLLSFILFSGAILVEGAKAFLRGRNFTLLGLVCGTFGFLVHSLFDTHLYSLQLSVLFWVMLGLILNTRRVRSEEG